MPTKADDRPSIGQQFAAGTVMIGGLSTLAYGSPDSRSRRLLVRMGNRLEPAAFIRRALAPLRPATLRTTGRRSGNPHDVTIMVREWDLGWLAASCLGADADWVRNIEVEPNCVLDLPEGSVQVRAAVLRAGSERNLAVREFANVRSAATSSLMRSVMLGRSANRMTVVTLRPSGRP